VTRRSRGQKQHLPVHPLGPGVLVGPPRSHLRLPV